MGKKLDDIDRKLAELAEEHRPLSEVDYLGLRGFLQSIQAIEEELIAAHAVLDEADVPHQPGQTLAGRIGWLARQRRDLEARVAELLATPIVAWRPDGEGLRVGLS